MAGLLVSMLSLMRLPNVRAQGGGLTIAPNSTEGLPLMEWQLKEAAAGFDAVSFEAMIMFYGVNTFSTNFLLICQPFHFIPSSISGV